MNTEQPLVDKDYQLSKTGSWTFVEIPEIVMPKTPFGMLKVYSKIVGINEIYRVMTQVLNIFLGCILFSVFVCGEEDFTPKKYMGLKGKVACIRDTVYDCTLRGFYPGSGEFKEVQIIEFDMEGNVVKTTDKADNKVCGMILLIIPHKCFIPSLLPHSL